MELGKITKHNIDIEPSHNQGFIVRVGCGRFVFKDVADLIDALNEFLSNPLKWELEYNKCNILFQNEKPSDEAPDETEDLERFAQSISQPAIARKHRIQ